MAALASSLSGNCEGVKLVKYITERMTVLAPQVVNAAETLGGNPSSKLAKKNLAAFKEFWGEMVEGMTDAVDLTVPIQDFMAVSGWCLHASVCVDVWTAVLGDRVGLWGYGCCVGGWGWLMGLGLYYAFCYGCCVGGWG